MRFKNLTAIGVVVASVGSAQAQWELYWQDEFEGSQLNLSNWEPMIGNGQAYGLAGWGNNELQYYTNSANNINVSDGTLKITARRQNFGGQDYTSARLRTVNRVDFKWGRIEGRMKLPSTRGIWPAFWMLPTNSPYGGWASSGEIDIMESVNFADRIYGTIHHGSPWPNNAQGGSSFSDGTDFSQDFHVYTVEWDPNQIRWYIDGQLFSTRSSSQWFSSAAQSNPRAPFDTDFHLLLNVAVGGNFPGNPDGSSQFPQTLEVDYVRVYQRTQQPLTVVPAFVPGLIEAENYDTGYPGDAYNDTDIGNNGGAFRQDDVDIEVCDEGGFNLGWVANGEWLEYTVGVSAAGRYLLETRVATPNSGGSLRYEVGGVDISGPIAVPDTGDWQNWQTVAAEVELDAGTQVIRLAKNDSPGDFNINWFRLTPLAGGCSDADLAEPFGTLNFFDVLAFIGAFNDQDPSVDFAEPIGSFNFFDVVEYLNLFNAGCP